MSRVDQGFKSPPPPPGTKKLSLPLGPQANPPPPLPFPFLVGKLIFSFLLRGGGGGGACLCVRVVIFWSLQESTALLSRSTSQSTGGGRKPGLRGREMASQADLSEDESDDNYHSRSFFRNVFFANLQIMLFSVKEKVSFRLL